MKNAPLVRMTEVCSMTTGRLDSNAAVKDGEYPFFTCAQETFQINTYAFDTEAVLLGGNNANGIFPLKYYAGKFNAYQRTYVLETRDPNVLLTRYLYYALMPALGHFRNASIGAATQYLTKPILDNFQIRLLSISTQRKIVAIASAYDDLIENNRRRIALLEQAARLLYKEWFVALRFPGHEHVKVKDGVPQGWENGTVEDLGEIITGKTPSTKEQENYGGDIPFVKTPDMHEQIIVTTTEQQLSERGADLQANKFLPKGAVMVSCIGTVGVVAIAGNRCQTNQQINSVVCHDKVLNYYAYFALSDLKPRLESIGGGATMPNVNKTKFSALPILIPDKKILSLFDEAVAPSFAQIETLAMMNEKLQQARDLLLPRLMNGELAV